MINTKPLIKFLLWTFTLFLICIIGASNVLAETITNMTFNQFRTTISTYGIVSNQWIYDTSSAVPVQMDSSPTGFAWEWITNYTSNCSGQTVISGQLSIPNDNLNYDWLDDNIKQIYYLPYKDYQGAHTLCNYSINPNNNIVSFTCSTAEPHDNFVIGGILQYRANSSFTSNFRIYRTFNITCDNSATAIIDNQSQNTQNIINNNNTNTQDIINNNDENTNKIIDENKKNFQDCGSNLLDGINYIQGNILNDGTYNYDSGRVLSDYFKVKQLTYNYEISDYLIFYIIEYDYQKSFISRTQINNTIGTFTPRNNTEYLRISFRKSDNTNLTPQDIKNASPTFYSNDDCTNKLDETKDAINDVNDTLKDDNVDDNGVADAFESFNDYLDDNSTITQLITLPITLYTAILNNLNGTCSPFNLGDLYGESLVLPCINISQYLGNSLWTMIDIIISGFAVYAISKKMIKVFNNFSSLREGDVIDD